MSILFISSEFRFTTCYGRQRTVRFTEKFHQSLANFETSLNQREVKIWYLLSTAPVYSRADKAAAF